MPRRHFADLYAVFSAPRAMTVLWGSREVGTVDTDFLEMLDNGQKRKAFVLGGKPWMLVRVDWNKGICQVEPSERADAPR